MSVFGENLDVVELQPITQAPSSTCPIRENSEDQTNEQDLQNKERTGSKNS